MTDLNGIISSGTDGSGEASAGSRISLGRAKSDPAEAETVSGSKGKNPSASSEVEGGLPPFSDGAAPGDPSSSAAGTPPAGEASPDTRGLQDEPSSEALEADLDELSRALQQRDEFKDLALRAKADFENYRKRADKKIAESRFSAVAGVVRELLPLVDNLDRALESAGEADDAFTQGIRLVHADLHGMLDRLGLTTIDPVGEPFDPNLHEAIAQAPIEGVASNTVAEVHQRGFMLGDVVVRPARVVVAA
ncbi:MAG: nucleotide exchange factor GrpE [Solirubrobacterales bacterium]